MSSLETPPPNRFSDFRVHYYLLKSKNVLIEIVLDLLIGDIYAELLKRISLKVLESKNIQDSHIHTIVCTTAQERTKSFREGNIYLRTVRKPNGSWIRLATEATFSSGHGKCEREVTKRSSITHS